MLTHTHTLTGPAARSQKENGTAASVNGDVSATIMAVNGNGAVNGDSAPWISVTLFRCVLVCVLNGVLIHGVLIQKIKLRQPGSLCTAPLLCSSRPNQAWKPALQALICFHVLFTPQEREDVGGKRAIGP